MTAKRKVSTTPVAPVVPARKPRAKLVFTPAPGMSDQEIDQKWEQIRVRGEQISADIKALMARVSTRSI